MPIADNGAAFHPVAHVFNPRGSRRDWPTACNPETWPEFAPAPIGPSGALVTRSALYRFYGKDHDPLYYGVTTNPFARWTAHRNGEWWRLARFVSIEPVEPAVRLAAEQRAIKVENPRFNVLRYSTVKTVVTFENGMADVVAQFRRRLSPDDFAALVAAFKAEPDAATNSSPTQ